MAVTASDVGRGLFLLTPKPVGVEVKDVRGRSAEVRLGLARSWRFCWKIQSNIFMQVNHNHVYHVFKLYQRNLKFMKQVKSKNITCALTLALLGKLDEVNSSWTSRGDLRLPGTPSKPRLATEFECLSWRVCEVGLGYSGGERYCDEPELPGGSKLLGLGVYLTKTKQVYGK